MTKLDRMRTVTNADGIIAALAMDQRRSLRKMIAAAGSVPFERVSDAQLSEFKSAVCAFLSPHATAILLDPEYGLQAAALRADNCGLLMTYESDGFENPRPHRMLELMPYMSVRRLADLGAGGVKILLSYAPDDPPEVNDQKHAFIERIGYECDAAALPFFLEPVVYDPDGEDPRSYEFARVKPQLVVRSMEEFSKPVYRVDVLKVEFPVNALFVEGNPCYTGRRAQSKHEALDWYRAADSAARVPYIYLSAGVSSQEFTSSLEMAAEAGARFSGVLCGRANWQGGVAEYARDGVHGLSAWLSEAGIRNMASVNACLRHATAWTVER